MTTKFSRFAFLFLLVGLGFTFTSCDDDSPQAEETPEAITQVKLTFALPNGAQVVATATSDDGETNFRFNPSVIELTKGLTYTLNMEFTNQLTDPDEDITEEIKEEADEHQIFFTGTALGSVFTNTTTNYQDEEQDYVADGCTGCTGSNAPVGLSTSWTVVGTANNTGTLKVQLKHQPDGQKNGIITSGEDDVNLDFSLKVID